MIRICESQLQKTLASVGGAYRASGRSGCWKEMASAWQLDRFMQWQAEHMACGRQVLSSRYSRRLITLEKVRRSNTVGLGQPAFLLIWSPPLQLSNKLWLEYVQTHTCM